MQPPPNLGAEALGQQQRACHPSLRAQPFAWWCFWLGLGLGAAAKGK